MPTLFPRIRKHFLGMTAAFIIIMLPVSVITCRQTPVFEVEAKIIVKDIANRSFSALPDNDAEGSKKSATALEILQGNILAEQVITIIGVTRIFPGSPAERSRSDALLPRFEQQLKISPVKGTRIIRISFRHQQPEIAVDVIDVLIKLFEKQYREIQEPQSLQREKQLIICQSRMKQAKKKLSMFKEKNRLYPSVEHKQSLVAQQEKLQSGFVFENKKLKELLDDLERLEQEYQKESLSGVLREDRDSFLRLKLYEHELLRKYEENDPLIASVREQIKMIRKGLHKDGEADDSVEKLANRIVLAKVAESDQRENTDAVRRQMNQLDNKLRQIAGQEKILKTLQAEADRNGEQCRRLTAKLEERRGPVEEENYYMTVLEKPVLPAEPVRPKILRNMLIAAVFGLLCSILYASIMMRRDNV